MRMVGTRLVCSCAQSFTCGCTKTSLETGDSLHICASRNSAKRHPHPRPPMNIKGVG
jgi:hypothetical protein